MIVLESGRAGVEVDPDFGLWLDWGGWPEDGPVHQPALEPATAAADDLVAAERLGQARLPAPGARARWRVAVTFLDPA